MGLFYGFIFGTLDIEDSNDYEINFNLLQEEFYCMPLASFIGLISGCLNEILRSNVFNNIIKYYIFL